MTASRRIFDLDPAVPAPSDVNGYTCTFTFHADLALKFNEAHTDDDEVWEWTVEGPDGDEVESGWARDLEEAQEWASGEVERYAHWLRLNGELKYFDDYDVSEVTDGDVTYWEVTAEGEDWVIFEDREDAEAVCRAYWEDMAKHDPEEFKCFVSVEALIAWGLGQSYKGNASLSDWLDSVAGECEYHFAGYDHEEVEMADGDRSDSMLENGYGTKMGVAYRRN